MCVHPGCGLVFSPPRSSRHPRRARGVEGNAAAFAVDPPVSALETARSSRDAERARSGRSLIFGRRGDRRGRGRPRLITHHGREIREVRDAGVRLHVDLRVVGQVALLPPGDPQADVILSLIHI